MLINESKLVPMPNTVIDSFHGEYHFLSNFHLSLVKYESLTYYNVEAAYQAAKTLDLKVRTKFAAQPSPGWAKRTGRTLALRSDWESIKLTIMAELLLTKFAPNTRCAQLLLATENAMLIEGNYWNDTFWGVCKGVGENHLGKILMQIRDKLRS